MTEKKTHQDALNVDHALNSSEAFIDKYKKSIMYGFVAVVVAVAGFFLYKNYVSDPREIKASEALFKGEQYFATDNYEKALNGDGQGYIGFLQIIKEYGSTKSGNLAELYAGMSYAQMGKYQDAVNFLESYDKCDDQMITPAAIGMLGNCYAQLNQLDKATETLLKAAKLADNNSLSPIYLIQAGEIYESQNNAEKALECYQQIKTKYINSMQYNDIDKYIERVSK